MLKRIIIDSYMSTTKYLIYLMMFVFVKLIVKQVLDEIDLSMQESYFLLKYLKLVTK